MDIEPALVLWAFTHVASSVYCALTAQQKRRSLVPWGLTGLALSLVGVLLVHLVRARPSSDLPEIEQLRTQVEALRAQTLSQRDELHRLRGVVARLRARVKRAGRREPVRLVAEDQWSHGQRRLLAWAQKHAWPDIRERGLLPVGGDEHSWRRLIGGTHPEIAERILRDLHSNGERVAHKRPDPLSEAGIGG